jgi:cytochrome c556
MTAMNRKPSAWYLHASCLAAVLLLAACSQGAAPSATTTTTAGTDAATAVKPVATIQDLMDGQIMPAADVLWGATSTTSDETGVHDNAPKTDADWNKLRRAAVTLIEASNMLIGERRKVAPVDLPADPNSNSLSSSDIEKLLDANWAGFAGFGVAMRTVGETLLKAVDERNLEAITDAGSTLDEVCESCHKTFWYPEPKQQEPVK